MYYSTDNGLGGCVRVFKVKGFARFQRRERISDAALCQAVNDAERGLVEADLGHGLIKQRVARPGQGKRGGFRTIIAYRVQQRAVFLFGFAKSRTANIDDDERDDLARLGAVWLAATDKVIDRAITTDELTEVYCDNDDE
jgi:hypothetical protein